MVAHNLTYGVTRFQLLGRSLSISFNVYLYLFQVKLLEKGITLTMTNAKLSQILQYKSILRRQGTLLVLPLTLRSLLLFLSFTHTRARDHANACMQNIFFYLLFFLWIETVNHNDIGSIVKKSTILIPDLLTQLFKIGEKDIVEMVFFPVVNEACRVLAEGIADKAADLDIASVTGMGFPAYRLTCSPIVYVDESGSYYSMLHLLPRQVEKLTWCICFQGWSHILG